MRRLRCGVAVGLLTFLTSVPAAAQRPQAADAAKVLSAQGTLEREQPPWVPVAVNTWLPVGSKVRTGDKSRAVLLLADETQLKLNDRTEIHLTNVRDASTLFKRVAQQATRSHESLVSLSKGEVWLRARNKPAEVKVATPAVTAAIRGTEFNISVGDDGESVITVLEGSVDYRNDFGAVQVNTGEQGRARVGQPPTKTLLLTPADAVQWTLAYSGAVSPRDFPWRYATAAEARAAAATAAGPIALAEARYDAGDLAGALVAVQGVTTPDAAELRGWIYLAQNRSADALAELGRAGDGPRARLGRSIAAFRLRRYASAYADVEAAADGRLIVQRAQLDLLSGDAASARTALEAIAPGQDAYAQAQALLSGVYLAQNRNDDARRVAEAGVAAAPDSPAAHLALSFVEQGAFNLPAAIRAAERARALDPAFVQANVQYANLLFGTGESGQAERVIRGALAVSPDEAMAHGMLGFVQLAQGKNAEARAGFTQALSLDSTQSEPHLGLGILAMREGQYEEAVEAFLSAASIEPRRSMYQTYLAKALYELRRFDQSFAALASARALDPRDPTPHLYTGVFENDLLRPGAAVRSFEESIRLNDGRAVYRSRFLLDEDLATRNVKLAAAYGRLGLTEWANDHAIASELADQGDSAAHLFLADTFGNMRGRLTAYSGELLLSRLLMPPNANSFNSLNNYTTLFDRPQANWSASAGAGSFNSSRVGGNAYGGTRRVAYSASWGGSRSDGFRPVNDDRRDIIGANLLKVELGPRTDLLATYTFADGDGGHHGGGLSSLVDETNIVSQRSQSRVHRGEIGLHHQVRPGSDLLAYVSRQSFWAETIDSESSYPVYPTYTTRTSDSPYTSYQAAHLVKLAGVQWRYGVGVYRGTEDTTTSYLVTFMGEPVPLPDEVKHEEVEFRTGFAQAIVPVSRRVTLTTGLQYDWANHDTFFLEGGEPMSRWNPSAGLQVRATASGTLRVAAMRVLQTHTHDRLSPTHVNGFPMSVNELPLSTSVAYNGAWDQRLGRDTFVRLSAFRRNRDVAGGSFCELLTCSNAFYGGGIVANRLITERWTLVPEYVYANAVDILGQRRDHEATLATYYAHPNGLSASLKGNYLHQRGLSQSTPNEVSAFTASMSVSYELPRKLGVLSVGVTNLTDRRYAFLADPLALDSRVPRRQFSASARINF